MLCIYRSQITCVIWDKPTGTAHNAASFAKDKDYNEQQTLHQAVFPKHTLKYSFKLQILILNRGDMDNKTGCSYTDIEEKTHPRKKNLRCLHKRNHDHVWGLLLMLTPSKQLSTAHKNLHIYNFSNEHKIQQSSLHLHTGLCKCWISKMWLQEKELK